MQSCLERGDRGTRGKEIAKIKMNPVEFLVLPVDAYCM
jgi:hypothetical protein